MWLHNLRVLSPDPKYNQKFAEIGRMERWYGLLLCGTWLTVALALIVGSVRWDFGGAALAIVAVLYFSFFATRRKLQRWPCPACEKPLHISPTQAFKPWPRRCPHCQIPRPSLWLGRSG
jgi:hypothetical protein